MLSVFLTSFSLINERVSIENIPQFLPTPKSIKLLPTQTFFQVQHQIGEMRQKLERISKTITEIGRERTVIKDT